jgi:hypothetical protein
MNTHAVVIKLSFEQLTLLETLLRIECNRLSEDILTMELHRIDDEDVMGWTKSALRGATALLADVEGQASPQLGQRPNETWAQRNERLGIVYPHLNSKGELVGKGEEVQR